MAYADPIDARLPARGTRLIPTTLDARAALEPDRPWAALQTEGGSDYTDLGFKDFADAVNRASWWLHSTLGGAGNGRVASYIGPADLRYFILTVGLIKAGFVPLSISHVNTLSANRALFAATKCGLLLHGFTDIGPLSNIPDDIDKLAVPSLDTLLSHVTPAPTFPYPATYEEMATEPLLIVHTSGSTGMPKPITYTHATFAGADRRALLPPIDGFELEMNLRRRARRVLMGFPPFHPAGMLWGLHEGLWFGNTIVLPPADLPLDAPTACRVIVRSRARGAILLPHVLEELARRRDEFESVVRSLMYLGWTGGPISRGAGDCLAALTTLSSTYASTEMGATQMLVKPDAADWQYYRFYPDVNGFDFRPIDGQPGLHELFIKKQLGVLLYTFTVFPALDEFATHDLFLRHPDPAKRDYWRIAGRSDDLVVLANGHKVNPTGVEAAVSQAQGVRSALVMGAGRARPALLVEPLEGARAHEPGHATMLTALRHAVDNRNKDMASNIAIPHELILLTSPDRPLPRTAKGTVQRAAALAMYAADIEDMYARLPPHLGEPREVQRLYT